MKEATSPKPLGRVGFPDDMVCEGWYGHLCSQCNCPALFKVSGREMSKYTEGSGFSLLSV